MCVGGPIGPVIILAILTLLQHKVLCDFPIKKRDYCSKKSFPYILPKRYIVHSAPYRLQHQRKIRYVQVRIEFYEYSHS